MLAMKLVDSCNPNTVISMPIMEQYKIWDVVEMFMTFRKKKSLAIIFLDRALVTP